MATKCPMCGNLTLSERKGEFRFTPPINISKEDFVIPNSIWYECSFCGEQLIPFALSNTLQECKRKLK